MFRYVCLALLAVNVWLFDAAIAADSFPALTGRVVDAAQILSPATEEHLKQELENFEHSGSGRQVVVVTVPTLGGESIEEYGYKLGRHWGIGDKEKNTGAILLVAPADRQVRIEVGYGFEGELTDALSRAMIERDILPFFKAGKMDEGVTRGLESILRALSGETPVSHEPRVAEKDPGAVPPVGLIILFLIFMFMGRRRHGGILPGLILGSPLIWRGGGGGGGGTDVFRGGGGSFGGGGASGRW